MQIKDFAHCSAQRTGLSNFLEYHIWHISYSSMYTHQVHFSVYDHCFKIIHTKKIIIIHNIHQYFFKKLSTHYLFTHTPKNVFMSSCKVIVHTI